MSDAEPDDVISQLKALQTRGVGNKKTQNIVTQVLAEHDVKERVSLLATHDTPNTPSTPDAKPGDIISKLNALQIRGVGNKEMQKIVTQVLAENNVKDWGRHLAAAPGALYAIGQCFIVAFSGSVGQIVQKKDTLMYSYSPPPIAQLS
jgi:hypothetical protein